MLFPPIETCAAVTQQAAPNKRSLNLCMIKLHQLSLHETAFDHAKTVSYGLQGGPPFRPMSRAPAPGRAVLPLRVSPFTGTIRHPLVFKSSVGIDSQIQRVRVK